MADHADWIFLGSAADCELRFPGNHVGAYHARCRLDSSGRIVLVDLGTPQGTSVNQPGRKVGSAFISSSDVVYLGSHPVPASMLRERLQRTKTPAPSLANPPDTTTQAQIVTAAQQIRLERGVTVIGREPDPINKQRMALPSPMLSRNHAAILRTEQDEYYVWDLGSTYGTYLDSQRVGPRRVRVQAGQIISVPGLRFAVGLQGSLSPVSAPETGIEIQADGLSSEAGPPWKRRLILENVGLIVPPKSLVALMGPSGAGKTTLLRILGGQTRPKLGRVSFGGIDLYRNYGEVRSSLGYVPQEDILHPQLTVRQALFYSARLRLPRDFSSAEILRRIDQILDKLGIANQSDLLIGSVENRGISGGQRKRVNLAMELIPDPFVLLLDEPTSGLSSADAEKVVRTLRQLADEGRTIIVTIHQPPPQVYEMFDLMAFIDNDSLRVTPAPPAQPGRLIYLGPARTAPNYFRNLDASGASRSIPGIDAVFTALERNPERSTVAWEREFHNSMFLPRSFVAPHPTASAPPPTARKNLPSAFRQLQSLISRLWHIKIAEPFAVVQMFVLQPILVAFGIALASGALHGQTSYVGGEYVKDFLRIGKTLFFIIFTAIWFGCNNTAREIVGEIPIYRRERMAGLNLGAYLNSKFIFFSGVAASQSFILVFLCSIVCELKANVFTLWLLVWLAAVCGVSMGLLISSLAPGSDKAIQLVPLAMLPMILFGGGVTRLADLETSFAREIARVIPARWAFEGALLAENSQRPISVPTHGVADKYTIVHHYFENSPHDDTRIWVCIAFLPIFAIVLLLLSAVAMRRQDVR